jgi:hypothetical protein
MRSNFYLAILPWFNRIWGCETTLELATRYYLGGYITEKIKELGRLKITSSFMTKLLFKLLRYFHTLQSRLFPLPTLRIVSLLLELGAKVNKNVCCHASLNSEEMTAWKNALLYSTRVSKGDSNSHKSYLHRRYIEIMTILVRSGADPKAHVLESDTHLSALEVVNKFLMPSFPLETIPLLRELELALEEQKLVGEDSAASSPTRAEEKEEDGPPPVGGSKENLTNLDSHSLELKETNKRSLNESQHTDEAKQN